MAKLSPVFNDQTFDVNGDPASGYKLFTYVAGSSTKQTTYSDEAGTVQNTNPIILDTLGYPTQGPIWLSEGQQTKFVLTTQDDTDPPTSPVRTIDNVSGVGDNTVSVSQWVSSGVTPTYVSANSFTLIGDQTSEFHVGRRVQFTVGAGTVYGNITASVFTTLTTIAMQMDAGMVLDAGLTVANLSILRADRLAIPSIFNQSFSMSGASFIGAKGVAVTSAAITNIWDATDGNIVDISDSNPINSLGTAPQAGYVIKGTFTGAPLITAGANLILNTAAPTFQVEVGDTYEAMANSTTLHSMVITRKSGAATSGLPRNYLAGFTMSTSGSSATMTVGGGQSTDSTNALMLSRGASIAKTTAAWAVGTGNGGLDTGAIAINTGYHFYEIFRPDTGVEDVIFSLSATSPALPANYTKFRRLGWGKTNASSQWTKFTQVGNDFYWDTPVQDFVGAGSTTAALLTCSLPSGLKVKGYFNLVATNNTNANIYITDPANADLAVATAASSFSITVAGGTGANAPASCWTNTAGQIRHREGGTANIAIVTQGWMDNRGRED